MTVDDVDTIAGSINPRGVFSRFSKYLDELP